MNDSDYNHKNKAIRAKVAFATSDMSIAKILTKDPHDDVRKKLAENHRITPEILHILYNDSVFGVKLKVCSNPNIDYALALRIIQDQEHESMLRLVRNPKCTPDILHHIVKTSPQTAPILRHIVKMSNVRSDTIELLLKSDTIIHLILENQNCPPHILVANINTDYRFKVVANPNCPKDILLKAASKPPYHPCIAANPKCDQDVLDIMMTLNRDRLRAYPQQASETLSNMIFNAKHDNGGFIIDATVRLVFDSGITVSSDYLHNVVSNVSYNKMSSSYALSIAYKHAQYVITSIVTHPNCPEDVMSDYVNKRTKSEQTLFEHRARLTVSFVEKHLALLNIQALMFNISFSDEDKQEIADMYRRYGKLL